LVVFSDPNHFTFIFSLSIVDTSDRSDITTYFNKSFGVLAFWPTNYFSSLTSALILVSVGLRRGLHLSVLVWAISHSQNQDIV